MKEYKYITPNNMELVNTLRVTCTEEVIYTAYILDGETEYNKEEVISSEADNIISNYKGKEIKQTPEELLISIDNEKKEIQCRYLEGSKELWKRFIENNLKFKEYKLIEVREWMINYYMD